MSLNRLKLGAFNKMEQVKRDCFNKSLMLSRLKQLFPIIVWLGNYSLENLRYDIIAGLTVGITMVPQCLAYGSLAYLTPEVGLYSSFAGQFIYILMGTSKDCSVGPDAVICMIAGGIIAGVNPLYESYDPSCAPILALVTGIVLIALAVFKLGFIVNRMLLFITSLFRIRGKMFSQFSAYQLLADLCLPLD